MVHVDAYMRNTTIHAVIILLSFSCTGQDAERNVGGPCEGCEALFEYGARTLNPVDTIPGFAKTEPKLHAFGTVYENDGTTPAANVILYFYQTNTEGIYETKGDEKGWDRRHGIYRAWVKTDTNGRYDLYTFRPASYPNTTVPQHIHVTVKEEDTIPYYIDSFFFEDDPYLPDRIRNGERKRGGSGIVKPVMRNGMLEVKRDITLGLHIPNYN